MNSMEGNHSDLISTGIAGLDTILRGGIPAQHAYLVKGTPGTGKTSLALQFLSCGVRADEPTVYVSFSESMTELQHVADSHGWPLDEMEVCELAADISRHAISGTSIFHGAEVDVPDVITKILDVVDEVQPTRLALDSLTALRNLAESQRHYRQALFQLKVALEEAGVTTIFVGEKSKTAKTEAESLVHGVFDLQMETPEYGPVHRRIEVSKLRGRSYETGYHDFSIVSGGLEVFPRIRPKTFRRETGSGEPIKSGIEALDRMLGGGLDRGTTSLILGPSGTGKTSIVIHYAIAAAERGERALVYAFTEDVATIKRRAENMQVPLASHLRSGRIRIRALDSAEVSPGEFAHLVRESIQEEDLAFVAVDSLNGYLHAMPNQRALVPHLHDLLTFLGNHGIVMMLVMTLSGLFSASPDRVANLSYLADTILYLRYFEQGAAIRKTITAVKHRTRDHEALVRELTTGRGGVQVGESLGVAQGFGGPGSTSNGTLES